MQSPEPLSQRDREPTGSGRFFHGTMTVITLAVTAFSVWGVSATGLRVQSAQLVPVVGVAVFLLALAAFYRWREAPKLVNVLLLVFWAVVFTNLHMFPMFIAARQPFPLRDEWFANLDRSLGFEVIDVVRWAQAHPEITRFLNICYDLLLPLMVAAIIVPPMVGRMRAGKEFAIGCLAAALIAIPIFAVLPGIGPWTCFDYSPSQAQRNCEAAVRSLKEPGEILLDLRYSEGLICFPSFHTILAILPAVALWPVPYARWPAAILAGLITLSTLTSGWHFLVDVLGGLVVVVLAVAVARMYSRVEARCAGASLPAPPAEQEDRQPGPAESQ